MRSSGSGDNISMLPSALSRAIQVLVFAGRTEGLMTFAMIGPVLTLVVVGVIVIYYRKAKWERWAIPWVAALVVAAVAVTLLASARKAAERDATIVNRIATDPGVLQSARETGGSVEYRLKAPQGVETVTLKRATLDAINDQMAQNNRPKLPTNIAAH